MGYCCLRLTVNILVFLWLTVNFFPLWVMVLTVHQTLPMASNTSVLQISKGYQLFLPQIHKIQDWLSLQMRCWTFIFFGDNFL